MSAHTPGPWTSRTGKTGAIYIETGEPRWLVAEIVGRANGESAFNARLIAAAPDLLDALKILSTLKEEQIKGARGGVLFLQVPMNELQIAWAAIAKAEGH